jgi:hypothetical protein
VIPPHFLVAMDFHVNGVSKVVFLWFSCFSGFLEFVSLSNIWGHHDFDSIFMSLEICEQVKVPVIVVGCKLDLKDKNQKVSLERVMSPIMEQFREIGASIECSALKRHRVLFIGALFCLSSFSLLMNFYLCC